jgi:hypothetical protein
MEMQSLFAARLTVGQAGKLFGSNSRSQKKHQCINTLVDVYGRAFRNGREAVR